MKPNHLAIIMDGNRRWAVSNNYPSYEGHRIGAKNLWNVLKDVQKHNIKYLTLFVFSTENWKRSKKEVLFLLTLLDQFLDDLELKVKKYNFKIRFIGDFSPFSKKIQKKILFINELTSKKSDVIITLALNYGGRYDIIYGINKILEKKDSLQTIKEEDFKGFTLNS
ncbi:polyprenyl diphosphate synthase, partial [Alphaproteobacteria bacterium]|nr:polyprenyl diphosphate synthase [Alphaproteobacteria bacterium]